MFQQGFYDILKIRKTRILRVDQLRPQVVAYFLIEPALVKMVRDRIVARLQHECRSLSGSVANAPTCCLHEDNHAARRIRDDYGIQLGIVESFKQHLSGNDDGARFGSEM